MTRHAAIHSYRVPLDPPLKLARGTLTERQGLILHLRQDGRQGFGEAAPLPGFSLDTLADSAQSLRRLAAAWIAEPSSRQVPAGVCSPAAAFAFDCARQELDGGPLVADPNRGGYPLLHGDRAQQQRQWQALEGEHPASVKLKLGVESPGVEAAWLQRLLADAPHLRLRLDLNRRWSRLEADAFANALAPNVRAAIDYIEEPCQELAHSLAWGHDHGLPLGLDESLGECGEQLPAGDALRVLVLKPTLVGSLDRLGNWIAEAQERGLRTLLSSCFESPLAVGQLAALARDLTPGEPPGLDTLGPWKQDMIRPLPGSRRPLLALEELPCLWCA